MGLLGKIFGKSKTEPTLPKGFVEAKIKSITPLTSESVEIHFDTNALPTEFKSFIPGQYITLMVHINGQEERRSYSICSNPEEGLAIGVKRVPNGKVSTYLTQQLTVDDALYLSKPEGNFKMTDSKGKYVFIAAGSGITPILSMAKTIEKASGSAVLLYGNRSDQQMMFASTLANLSKTEKHYYLSKENKDGFLAGRLDMETLKLFFKENLTLLRADGFYICGPEPMIKGAIDALKFYGVSDEKVHFELFTEAVLLKNETPITAQDFDGTAQVEIILDGMNTSFPLNTKKETILEAALNFGLDAPYSCKGGVCSTCRAKVLEGSVHMKNNLTLTDKEVEEGYILTCQSHPSSEKVQISYDD
jgi:ring-1,2-phenylacetyl-CoA epoxidase subunit PaaE